MKLGTSIQRIVRVDQESWRVELEYTDGYLFLVGDCPELGDWDYDRAVPMSYVNSNTWCVDVPFDGTCGTEFAYKYFVRVGGKISRERALPRRRTAPSEGYRRFRDDWSSHLPE